MIANIAPHFVDAFIAAEAIISAANTNRDGTGTVVTVVTGALKGTLIELVRVKATGTTTAGMVRLFIHDGTNFRLYAEISVTAITPSATIQTFEAEYVPTKPLILPSGYSLRATTHNAESFTVLATGGDY